MKRFLSSICCATLASIAVWHSPAFAANSKVFRGDCRSQHEKWKRYDGFGAAAVSKTGRCGFSWNYNSAPEARQSALSACQTGRKVKGCEIVLENRRKLRRPPPNKPIMRGAGETGTLEKFQARFQLSKQAMKEKFGAVGRIVCPEGMATVFLIARPDIFITSDHLFLAQNKHTPALQRPEKCYLEFFYSQKKFRIKAGSLIHGFRVNKSAYNFEWFDWAIGRLDHAVDGIMPFDQTPRVIAKDVDVAVISQGMNDTTPRICIGKVTYATSIAIVSDFNTNCDVGPGASGGPVIAVGLDGPTGNLRSAIGLTRGYTGDTNGWQPGWAHLAIPIHDDEIEKALRLMLQQSGNIQQ
jgi:hypothetical protein